MATRALVLVALSGATACATTSSTVPAAERVMVLPRTLAPLRGRPLALQVIDQRPQRADSDLLVSTTTALLAAALRKSEVDVTESAKTRLEVTIVRFASEFSAPYWEGCVAMEGSLGGLGSVAIQVPASQCVRRWNTGGNATADEVLQNAYEAALSDLLQHLDEKLSEMPAPPAAPRGAPRAPGTEI